MIHMPTQQLTWKGFYESNFNHCQWKVHCMSVVESPFSRKQQVKIIHLILHETHMRLHKWRFPLGERLVYCTTGRCLDRDIFLWPSVLSIIQTQYQNYLKDIIPSPKTPETTWVIHPYILHTAPISPTSINCTQGSWIYISMHIYITHVWSYHREKDDHNPGSRVQKFTN